MSVQVAFLTTWKGYTLSVRHISGHRRFVARMDQTEKDLVDVMRKVAPSAIHGAVRVVLDIQDENRATIIDGAINDRRGKSTERAVRPVLKLVAKGSS